jgi:hypothetical protein
MRVKLCHRVLHAVVLCAGQPDRWNQWVISTPATILGSKVVIEALEQLALPHNTRHHFIAIVVQPFSCPSLLMGWEQLPFAVTSETKPSQV